MIVNCKERFGYTYLWTCDKVMYNILEAYCEGRSFLWNIFLGWRKTDHDKLFYWIPTRKIETLINLAEEIKKSA